MLTEASEIIAISIAVCEAKVYAAEEGRREVPAYSDPLTKHEYTCFKQRFTS